MKTIFSLTLVLFITVSAFAPKAELEISLEDALQIVFDQPQVAAKFKIYPRFQHEKSPLYYIQEHELLPETNSLTVNEKPIGILKSSELSVKNWENAIKIEKIKSKKGLISLELSYREPKLFVNEGKIVFVTAELKKESKIYKIHKLEVEEK